MSLDKFHILFLGKRIEAHRAAKRMGLAFSVLHDKDITKTKSYSEFSFFETKKNLFHSLNNISHKVTHIIPVTEYGTRVMQTVCENLSFKNGISNYISSCFNKIEMKERAKNFNIPITDYLYLKKWDSNFILKKLGNAVVAKEVASSGSRNLFYLNSKQAIENINLENVLVEKKIIGEEFSIETFVQNGQVVFENATQYYRHHICNILPYKPIWIQEAFELNRKIISSFGIQNSITHAEYYKTEAGFIFGEIAVRPPGGYIMKLLNLAYDIDSWEMLIRIHLNLPVSIPNQAKASAACWILYPKTDFLHEVPDLSDIKKMPSVTKIESRLSSGLVRPRRGSGEDYGYILLKDREPEELFQSLKSLEEKLKI